MKFIFLSKVDLFYFWEESKNMESENVGERFSVKWYL